MTDENEDGAVGTVDGDKDNNGNTQSNRSGEAHSHGGNTESDKDEGINDNGEVDANDQAGGDQETNSDKEAGSDGDTNGGDDDDAIIVKPSQFKLDTGTVLLH